MSGTHDGPARMLGGAWDDLVALVFPARCAACDDGRGPVCAACAVALQPRPSAAWVGGLRVWSGLPYEGAAARVLRAVKGDARPRLLRALAPALAAALRAAADEGGAAPGSLHVVPVPAGAAALRRRGFRVVDVAARYAGVTPEPRLRLVRRTADQRTLGREDRARNQRGSMTARDAAGMRAVIVDDVVTTGATLTEAARALTAAGAEVVAAATIATTPRRSANAGDGF